MAFDVSHLRVLMNWRLLAFIAFSCSSLLVLVFEIESVLSQNPKQQMPLVARFGFSLLVLAFRCSFVGNKALPSVSDIV